MAITSYLYQILIFLKKKEFKLPTQHIYSKISLSSEEQKKDGMQIKSNTLYYNCAESGYFENISICRVAIYWFE